MSLYFSSSGARKGEYDDTIGLDIDDGVVKSNDDGSYYDYDLLIRGVSGSGVIIPGDVDDGFPKRSDYTFQDTSSSMYRKATQRDDGMAGRFQLKAFVSDDQSATLDSMLDGANNGLVSDINITRDNPLPPETSLVIKKDNVETSIKGILEDNSINDIFFSDMNTKVIQDTIRYKVNKNTGEIIARQSDNELYIIMRSIMLQFANFRVGIDEIIDEIKRLNQRVIDYAVDNISSNVQQHKGYIDKLSKLPIPLDLPVYHNKNNFTYDISNLI
jgi:hypothetical protein